MSITKVKQIIAESNDLMVTPLSFNMGRGQAINMFQEGDTPLLWLITPNHVGTLVSSMVRLLLRYNVELFIYYNDKVSQSEDVSSALIESAETYAHTLFKKIRETSDIHNVDLDELTIVPVYKYSAKGVFTGVSMTFNMTLPDSVNIC